MSDPFLNLGIINFINRFSSLFDDSIHEDKPDKGDSKTESKDV
jgi:hypothetical protein